MKKLLIVGIIAYALFALAVCDGNGGIQDTAEAQEAQDYWQHQMKYPPNDVTTPALEFPIRTIEELGGTMHAAGAFWEDWWNLRGILI